MAKQERIQLEYRRHGFNPWCGKTPHAAEQRCPYTTTIESVLRAQEMQLLSTCAAVAEAYTLLSPCSAARDATTMRSPHSATQE